MKTPNSLTKGLEKNSDSNASNAQVNCAPSGSKKLQKHKAPSYKPEIASSKFRGPFHYFNNPDIFDGSRLIDKWTDSELLDPNRFVISFCGRAYYVIDGIDELKKFLNNNKKHQHFFECVTGNKKQKLRFDFDGDLETTNECWLQKFFDATVQTVVKTFNQIYDRPLLIGYDVLITDSSEAGKKFSKHIIINRFCVENATECNNFYLQVMKNLKSIDPKYHNANILDSSIYKSFQQFRILGSCKPGTTRFKNIPTSVIVDGQTFQQNPLFEIKDTLLSFVEGCELLPKIMQSNQKKNIETVSKMQRKSTEPVLDFSKRNTEEETFELNRKCSTLKMLLSLIDRQKRMIGRKDWINVGLIIYNEVGSLDFDLGLDLYQTFCDPAFHAECHQQFKSFKLTEGAQSIKIGTLISWAKEDCPQVFCEPFRSYIFEEPNKYSVEQLLSAAKSVVASGQNGSDLYDLMLADRKLKGNNLPIYDPNNHVFYNKVLRWTDQLMTPSRLKQLKRYLSQCMAVIENGGNRSIMCKIRSDDGMISYSEMSYQKWKTNHSFSVYECNEEHEQDDDKPLKKPKRVPFFKIVEPMMADFQFECAAFIPYSDANDRAKIPSHIFNTFTGFKAQHTTLDPSVSSANLIQPMLDHLKLLCGAEADIAYDYLLKWIAFKLQFPRAKIGVGLVMRSLQGAGKNLPFDFISQFVIGEQYYQYVNKIEQITGDFNGLMHGNLLTFLDEIQNYGGAYKSNDFLKSVLTNVKQNFNKKNIESFTSNDYSHYIFATNSKWPVKVTKDDRRHFCISPSTEKIGNKEYFDNLGKTCFNDQCGRAFYDFLMSIDLSNWNPQKIPQTQFRNELIQFSQPKVVFFLEDLANTLNPTKQADESKNCNSQEDETFKFTLESLYSKYTVWFSDGGFSNWHGQKLNKIEFSSELKQFVDEHPELHYKKCCWESKTGTRKRKSILSFYGKIKALCEILCQTHEESDISNHSPLFADDSYNLPSEQDMDDSILII